MLSIRILPKFNWIRYSANRACCSRYSCDLYLYIAIQWEHNSEKGLFLYLPDLHHMLHDQTYDRYSTPAGSTNDNGFATCFDKLYHITVQADRSHSHDDHKFRQLLHWLKYFRIDSHMYTDCRDDRCYHKVKYKHWKCPF